MLTWTVCKTSSSELFDVPCSPPAGPLYIIPALLLCSLWYILKGQSLAFPLLSHPTPFTKVSGDLLMAKSNGSLSHLNPLTALTHIDAVHSLLLAKWHLHLSAMISHSLFLLPAPWPSSKAFFLCHSFTAGLLSLGNLIYFLFSHQVYKPVPLSLQLSLISLLTAPSALSTVDGSNLLL